MKNEKKKKQKMEHNSYNFYFIFSIFAAKTENEQFYIEFTIYFNVC